MFNSSIHTHLRKHRVLPAALVLLLLLLTAGACTAGRAPATAVPPVEEAAAPTVAPVETETGETVALETETETAATAATAEAAGADTTASTPAPPLLLARVGINAQFEPFVFKEESGQVVGFDIDLINALAQAGNFEVTFIDQPFEQLLTGVAAGELDAAISAITITDERVQQVDFSAPYFESGKAPVSYFNPGQGLAVRLDESTIASAENLTSQVKVGVKADTTGAQFVATETDAAAVSYPEAAAAFAALRNGDVDAVVIDIPVIVRYITNTADAGIRITGGPLTDEAYGIAVNPARPELLTRIDAALTQIRTDGTYDQLFEKWFGSP